MTLGTLRLRMLYTSVGVTSAIALIKSLSFLRSSHQKQRVQCRFSTM